MTERVELAHNAAQRRVPTMVNGKPQIPYLGVGKYQPRGRKQRPVLAKASALVRLVRWWLPDGEIILAGEGA